jgi:hypothetical protein
MPTSICQCQPTVSGIEKNQCKADNCADYERSVRSSSHLFWSGHFHDEEESAMLQNRSSPGDGEALRKHVFATYLSLRIGMAVAAFVFPIVLYIAGRLEGMPLLGSMSAYYWATMSGDPPGRVWLIGGLFAIGACLYLYKGFSQAENIALNLAALFALGVAYFPMEWNCVPGRPLIPPLDVKYCVDGWNPHGFCALMHFVCLAYVTFFRSTDTLLEIKDEKLREKYRWQYRITTVVMLAAPLAAAVLHAMLFKYNVGTYLLEMFGIWAFAYYWTVKTFEMRHSHAEEKALQGKELDLDQKAA